jgi:hypothetical protein
MSFSLLTFYRSPNGFYLFHFQVANISLRDLTEEDLVALLSGSSGRQGKRDQSYKFPDYEYVHEELGKVHVTLTMLWEEYVEHCMLENKKYYRETQFRRYYHQFARSKKSTIRLIHKPKFQGASVKFPPILTPFKARNITSFVRKGFIVHGINSRHP